MEDEQIFLLILWSTCIYFAQMARLSSDRETSSQTSDQSWVATSLHAF